MERAHFRTAAYAQFARIGKAIANPARLELLDLLCQGPRTVVLIAREAGLGLANTSQHLKVLRAARLVEAEKEGLFVTYRLADPAVCDFFRALRRLAESRLAEVREMARDFLEGHKGMEAVDREVLLARVHSGATTVLDVRPAEEYRAGHLPGAVSIPLRELRRRLSELPRDREVVAYCRGPYCVLAVKAIEILRSRGFRATRLDQGIQDLRAQGFRIVAGPER